MGASWGRATVAAGSAHAGVFPPDGSGAGVRLPRLDRASDAALIAASDRPRGSGRDPRDRSRRWSVTEDEQGRREEAARRFFDVLAVTTEHEDVTRVQAFRDMCEAAIRAYDGTDDAYVADWAREALRRLGDRGKR